MAEEHWHIEDSHLHLATQQVRHGGSCALIRDMDHVELRLVLEELDSKVGDAAASGGTEVHFPGVCFYKSNQLGKVAHRQRWMHCKHLRHAYHERDERDVLLRIVWDPGERIRRDRERRAAVEAERIAVGRRLQRAIDP